MSPFRILAQKSMEICVQHLYTHQRYIHTHCEPYLTFLGVSLSGHWVSPQTVQIDKIGSLATAQCQHLRSSITALWAFGNRESESSIFGICLNTQ